MKDKDFFNRAVRLTRIKVWLQKRFWKWINGAPRISEMTTDDAMFPVLSKVEKYATAIRHIDKELGNIIWLEGYKKKQKEG